MPIYVAPRNIADGDILFEADLDEIKESLETLINVTGFDNLNISANSLTGEKLASGFVDDSTLEISSNQLQIKDDGVLRIHLKEACYSLPVGGVEMMYDYGALISIPSNYVICDGSVISNSESPLNGRYTPNMVNAYAKGATSTTQSGISSYSQSGADSVDFTHNHLVFEYNGQPPLENNLFRNGLASPITTSFNSDVGLQGRGGTSGTAIRNSLHTANSNLTLTKTPLTTRVLYIMRVV